jgi:hypothetical protein
MVGTSPQKNLPQVAGINGRIDIIFKRLGAVEKAINQLTTDLGGALRSVGEDMQMLSNALGSIEERLGAAITVLGPDEIREAVQAARAAKVAQQQATLLEAVQKQVVEGRLKPAEKVEDAPRDESGKPTASGSVVVGVEFDEAGGEVPPGKIVLQMANMKEQFRAPLVGVAPGTDVQVPRKRADGTDVTGTDGKPLSSKFRVLEAYQIVQPPAEPAAASPAPAAPEAEASKAEG